MVSLQLRWCFMSITDTANHRLRSIYRNNKRYSGRVSDIFLGGYVPAVVLMQFCYSFEVALREMSR